VHSSGLKKYGLGTLVSVVCLLPLTLNAQPLPGSINTLLERFGIPVSAVSLEIRESESRNTILSINSDTPRNPASVIKLVTTLSALEILGPEFQWETKYWATGPVGNGVLKGDMVIQGGGDPFLTVDRFWYQVLSLHQQGIQSISGSLVIDNSRFDTDKHDRAMFDGQPTRLYNVGPDAALVNFSATRFVIHPSSSQINVFAEPPLADLVIENNIKPASGKCINRNSGWSYGIHRQGEKVIARFNGKYRSRCGQHSLSRSVVSNQEYTFRLFKYLWNSSGGSFEGGYRIASTPEDSTLIHTFSSKPLADIVTSINKYSNNVMARQLLLTLHSEHIEGPGNLKGARAVVTDWLTENIGAMPELHIDNGSGLSRTTRITTANLVDVLQHGWDSNFRPEFLSSLPLSALDGTMRKRLKDSALEGRARIKTGLIKGVRSMAGYVNASDGTHYSVAMLIDSNKVNFWNGNQIQDAVLKWVYGR
jgi:D-alanyl-D-alanine carboxypeptidase/D-alanyl-D-alanine-endopeptidase (penicillin-binding protein 4)